MPRHIQEGGNTLSPMSVQPIDDSASYFEFLKADGSTKILTVDTVTPSLIMQGNKISGVLDPTSAQDAATKAYVDASFGGIDAILYKGAIDCSANPNYPAADAGHAYKISVAGKIGGASGTNVEAGDLIICTVDASASGTQAAVGANWDIIQTNLDGALVASPSTGLTSGSVLFSGGGTAVLQDATKFYYDDTNNRLGVGIGAPTATSHLVSGGTDVSLIIKGSTADTSATTLNTTIEVYDSANALRSRLYDYGVQEWYFITSGVERGAIKFSTPGARPGVTFYDGDGLGRSQIFKHVSGGGLGIGSSADASNPGAQFKFALTGDFGVGTSSDPTAHIVATGVRSKAAWGATSGGMMRIVGTTLTDTTSSGTVAAANNIVFESVLYAASSATVYTDAATLYIEGAPTASTNVTVTNGYALWVDAGQTRLDGTTTIQTNTGGTLRLGRTDTSVTAGDTIGLIEFRTNDTSTTTNLVGASIEVFATNTIATDINPTRMVISTTSTTVGASPTGAIDISNAQNVGIGTGSTVSARLHAIATTEQARFGYDSSNYYSTTVSSAGLVTYDAVGASAGFRFNDTMAMNTAPSASIAYDALISANAASQIRIRNLVALGNTSASAQIGVASFDSSGFFGAFPSDFVTASFRDRVVFGANSDSAGFMLSAVSASQTIDFYAGSSTMSATISANGDLGVGTTSTVSARLHAIKTTEQMRIGYDTSNYYSTTVSSTGGVTLNAVGSGSAFTFSDNVTATRLLTSTSTSALPGLVISGGRANALYETTGVTGGGVAFNLVTATVANTDPNTATWGSLGLYGQSNEGVAAAPILTYLYLSAQNVTSNYHVDPTLKMTSTGFTSLGLSSTTAPTARLQLSGSISANAWTTNGIMYRGDNFTATDLTSSGTVGLMYINKLGVATVVASSTTTYTIAATLQLGPPVASTNVTITNPLGLYNTGSQRIDGNIYIGAAFDGRLLITGASSWAAWGVTGPIFSTRAQTVTDTSSSGTVATAVYNSFGVPTAVASSSTTYTDSATLYVANRPTASTNVTITNGWAVWVDAGNSRFDGRVAHGKGANVAAANDLTLGMDGNLFNITGATQINGIAVAGWTAGSMITLYFASTPTVKHNTAASAGFASILLAGAVDFVASADDTLTIIYDGTTWRECARAVI